MSSRTMKTGRSPSTRTSAGSRRPRVTPYRASRSRPASTCRSTSCFRGIETSPSPRNSQSGRPSTGSVSRYERHSNPPSRRSTSANGLAVAIDNAPSRRTASQYRRARVPRRMPMMHRTSPFSSNRVATIWRRSHWKRLTTGASQRVTGRPDSSRRSMSATRPAKSPDSAKTFRATARPCGILILTWSRPFRSGRRAARLIPSRRLARMALCSRVCSRGPQSHRRASAYAARSRSIASRSSSGRRMHTRSASCRIDTAYPTGRDWKRIWPGSSTSRRSRQTRKLPGWKSVCSTPPSCNRANSAPASVSKASRGSHLFRVARISDRPLAPSIFSVTTAQRPSSVRPDSSTAGAAIPRWANRSKPRRSRRACSRAFHRCAKTLRITGRSCHDASNVSRRPARKRNVRRHTTSCIGKVVSAGWMRIVRGNALIPRLRQ